MHRYQPILIIACVLVVAIAAGALLLRSNNDDTSNADAINPLPEQKKEISPDTVVMLEEYGDYECAPCGELHPTLKQLKQEFGPNLNFVFRNLPLPEIHKNALVAAQAAEAARRQNKFWEMHDLLYENQQLWEGEANPRPTFLKFARDLGLDVDPFTQDMDGEQVRFRIEADRDEAARRSIDATPTIFIDGRRLRTDALTPAGIRKRIEARLAGTDPPGF
ncbi:MAG: DsbA family protein [Acidobacteriota bacterium]|nr:DsbA family protein [Acidobacteriota bacterium]